MPTPSEHLCLSCGLCCDGSLFWAVPVGRDEDPPVPRDRDGRLRQPCPRFKGACTIYPDRPRHCRAFNCKVLMAVEAGGRDRAWAEAQIAAMRAVLAALDKALPGEDGSIYRRVAEYCEANRSRFREPLFQATERRLLQQIAEYEKLLARFHVPKKDQARGV